MHRFVRRTHRLVTASVFTLVLFATSVQGVAAADAPNSCAGATTGSALNTWISGAIETGSDTDWYRFTTSASGYALMTLGDLPKNYRLDLYNSSCTLITGSNRSGVVYEEILRSLAAGRYYLRVAPTSSSTYSPTAYVIKFRTPSNSVQVLSSAAWTDSYGYLHIPGEVLNNTPNRREYVEITATYYNSANQVLATDFTFTNVWTVNARQRAAFELLSPRPTGYHHYKLSVSSSVTSVAPIGNLVLAGGVNYTDAYIGRHFVGEVTNKNSFVVDFVQVVLTLYNARGGVFHTDFTFTNPYTLASGQTAPFDVWTERYVGTNRYIYSLEGTR